MAFSTQKDFFHVPFMNESVEYGCKKACVKLKSYESTIDDRSWAFDDAKQSKFLSDLVTCQLPLDYGEGDASLSGEMFGDGGESSPFNGGGGGSGKLGGGRGDSSKLGGGRGDSSKLGGRGGDGSLPQLGDLATGGDSLLECANIHLAEYQKVLKIKESLEKQLEISNERLETANEENKKIREILTSKLDSNTAKDFFNKIQKLTAAGKLGKNEENEMLQIYQKMENMNKSFEILQAENNYLKRLIEKLYARSTLESIPTEPEKSNDVAYLQKEVNNLRKECKMLRQMEDEYRKLKQMNKKPPTISEQDAENIKAIIKERNSLREKCKSFEALKKQVQSLEKKAKDASKEAGRLSSTLSNQSQYIDKMEGEMHNMQKYYEDKCQNSSFNAECLRSQIEDLKDELIKAKCQAQRAEMLAMEIANLRKALLEKDLAINDYDCQYKQLMGVVAELQCVKLNCLNDNQTQTCKNETDELTLFTCATLEEIIKELKRKGCLDGMNDEELIVAAMDLGSSKKGEQDCCSEMRRLQEELDKAKKQLEGAANCEELCADALKRLKELEAENAKLLQANKDLNDKIKESEEKLSKMLKRVEELDSELNKCNQEAQRIGKDVEGTKGLVQDISNVQLQNQQMTNAVSAINSRDDQKIIDDLRRQLEEELAKLRKCQQENARLIEEAQQREKELKELKDLNKKLEAEKAKLIAEKENLAAERDKLIIQEQQGRDQDDGKSKLKIGKPDDTIKDINRPKDTNETKIVSKDIDQDKNLDKEKQITPERTVDDRDIHKDSNIIIRTPTTTSPTKAAALFETAKKKAAASPKPQSDKDKAAALDTFVKKQSDSFQFNLQQGRGFEKELRKILEEFIRECGFCFCRLVNPKSKLYTICHKLYHCGLNTLSFRELAYLHKKVYARAEQLVPGCLLDMILSDNKEKVESILYTITPSLDCGGGTELSYKLSDANVTDIDPKCCCCKNELCCNNSDEMLKDKVNKLEKDFEIASKYLEALTNLPLDVSLTSDNDGDLTDTNNDNSTFRATSNMDIVCKSSSSKHLKKLKTRQTKHANSLCRL